MKTPLTADQKEAFFRQAIDADLFQSAEGALQEVLALWEERERARMRCSDSLVNSGLALTFGERFLDTRERRLDRIALRRAMQ